MKNSALVVIDLQNDITKNHREINHCLCQQAERPSGGAARRPQTKSDNGRNRSVQTVIEKIKSLRIKRIGCACLLLALLPVAAAAGAQTLDEQVDRIFRDAKTVGGAFLVAQEGEIVYERYYGEQQKTTHVPVTEKSYFRCASVTKLVTGIGLMR